MVRKSKDYSMKMVGKNPLNYASWFDYLRLLLPNETASPIAENVYPFWESISVFLVSVTTTTTEPVRLMIMLTVYGVWTMEHAHRFTYSVALYNTFYSHLYEHMTEVVCRRRGFRVKMVMKSKDYSMKMVGKNPLNYASRFDYLRLLVTGGNKDRI
ncbi:hypothetical protein F2Q70_00013379 [Brassica cretica]|uniref:Uncharacterized protein n=1 Tax=Brassica cretica TaxID=69181 RepID=A0A8S9M7L7_BRACR|nr:hypothetical protein F2Q70_00013379 [Brassica cretica]